MTFTPVMYSYYINIPAFVQQFLENFNHYKFFVVTVRRYYPARRFAQQNPELASAKMLFIAFCVHREACYCSKTTLLAYYYHSNFL